ncbi:MAG: M15 family metallopeptidase [Candidatus Liptonbacteria bacterium]|nr:M15 family metallopeptidase [Candidatus Liptonbacteria bacterium]
MFSGEKEGIIVDSQLSESEALEQNPVFICPPEILERQKVLEVVYYSFDGKLHRGHVVVDNDLSQDISEVFDLMREIKFPVTSSIPIADKRFKWDDNVSTEADNSPGFNYRMILNTNRLSNHSFGRAIDINPRLNPYFPKIGAEALPKGAIYDISKPGTLFASSEIVLLFKKMGWTWGGNWTDRKDYQHFEKPLK